MIDVDHQINAVTRKVAASCYPLPCSKGVYPRVAMCWAAPRIFWGEVQ